MPDNPPETLPWRVRKLEDEIAELRAEVKDQREKGDVRERNFFVAGITFLGGIIFSLIAVLWANLGAIFPR